MWVCMDASVCVAMCFFERGRVFLVPKTWAASLQLPNQMTPQCCNPKIRDSREGNKWLSSEYG